MGLKFIWVQTALTTVVRIIEILVLHIKLGKTKATVCTPGFIWGKQGVAAYKKRVTVEG